MKKITEAPIISSMLSSQSFLVEAGDSLKRIKLANIEEALASSFTTPPTTYTLEGTSSPEFDVDSKWAAQVYQSYMGGYMMKIVNSKAYAAKLDPSNWNYFADGTAVDDASKYETMVHVPKCHYKASGKTMHFGGLSAVSGGKTFESPEWVGAYLGYVDSNSVLHSRPDVSPSHSINMTSFWNYAQKNNSNFGLANYGFHCLINALFQASYGNLNSQSVVGAGWNNSNYGACRDVKMGLLRELGDGTGSVLYNDSTIGDQHPTKLFGFEDLWSKLWEFRPGVRFYMDGDTRYAVVYSGNIVSNTADGRKFQTFPASINGQYVTGMHLGEYWDMLPDTGGGSDSTYYCDLCYAATGGELLRVGGSASDGSGCGLSCAVSYVGFTNAYTDIGARLAFYGSPIIVDGSELMAM